MPDVYDELTGALDVIDVLHHEIHEGHAFVVSHLFEDIGAGATVDILIKQTSQPLAHVVFSVSVGADSRIWLYNAPVLSDWGTELRVFNKDRSYPDQSKTRWFYSPGVSEVGTLLWAGFIGGGNKKDAVGGSIQERDEWILKENVQYLLRVTNISAGAADISFQATYYEHNV